MTGNGRPDRMSVLKDLKFYATQAHPCSYLSDRQAITLFMDPATSLDSTLYSHLSDIGFRRSGRHIYRPRCNGCNACIPARVVARDFVPRRSQKKTWNKNQDLQVTAHKAINDDETYELYQLYINNQHKDGDMYPATEEQFESFLVQSPEFCTFYKFRLKGQLIAVAVTDRLTNGLSAIYTFYHPLFSRRSLGRFCILWQIEQTRAMGLEYLHLGYWIKGCQKMNYKIQYRPLEIHINNRWVTLK